MSAVDEIGPALPSRLTVLMQAREIQELAARAVEFSGTGPTRNLAVALKQFERIRAILGVMASADDQSAANATACPQVPRSAAEGIAPRTKPTDVGAEGKHA